MRTSEQVRTGEGDPEGAPQRVALLTGGGDKAYSLALAVALSAAGNEVDYIGSNDQDDSRLRDDPRIRFLNLRGAQSAKAGAAGKLARVLVYYVKLIRYAATARPRVFHILWNNKFQTFDCTALMLYYRLLGKMVVMTAHNVNAGKRDGKDSWWNRFTLRVQYRLTNHLFVHTQRMKQELVEEFQVPGGKVTVIPHGIHNSVPATEMTQAEARESLGLPARDKTILFFGNVAPYKGVEYLVAAFNQLAVPGTDYRLVIAGRCKDCPDYRRQIEQAVKEGGAADRVTLRTEFIPDAETELYFKAADVMVLPYTFIFQSGVLFLSYNFGLPVIASDLEALRDEIVVGETGLVFRTLDAADLARTIQQYFGSELYRDLEVRRSRIQEHANERYSWAKVAAMTTQVYAVAAGGRAAKV